MRIIYFIFGIVFTIGWPMLWTYLFDLWHDFCNRFLGSKLSNALWMGAVPFFFAALAGWAFGTIGLFGLAFGAF
jgi:hypothetical protein